MQDAVFRQCRFNSRTPGGVRRNIPIVGAWEKCFNSRTPGGVRRVAERIHSILLCFNSRTPGGVRLPFGGRSRLLRSVSIHAPREGCDTPAPAVGATAVNVSIHAPREGCDKTEGVRWDNMIKFQFTHPGRGATHGPNKVRAYLLVSIHAPREGCDVPGWSSSSRVPCFNSRTPGGVRLFTLNPIIGQLSFNSRTPGGVRPYLICLDMAFALFQFTHPGRGATDLGKEIHYTAKVSIHAPREGCD